MEDNLGLEVLFKGYYGVENDAVKAIWPFSITNH